MVVIGIAGIAMLSVGEGCTCNRRSFAALQDDTGRGRQDDTGRGRQDDTGRGRQDDSCQHHIGGVLSKRQGELEGAPLPHLALHPDSPSVSLHKHAGNVEAQA